MTERSATADLTERPGQPPDDPEPADAAPLAGADLLVEEVSIDGMCGVY